jgi:hypothetical protein
MQSSPTEPEVKTCKVLLDECVSIRTERIASLGQYEFYHSVKVVGRGAKDSKVAQAAIDNDYLLVTADRRFMRLAQSQEMQVAFFNHQNGKVYVWQEVMTLPLVTIGAPIKPARAKVRVKPKVSKWAKFKRALLARRT